MIEIVVAYANNRVIGYQGKMPWGRLPRDLQYFREITLGEIIVVGYTTQESIGKTLPGRTTLVLTNDPKKVEKFPGCTAISSTNEVLQIAEEKRVLICGGSKVYEQFIPYATFAHVTRIDGEFEGDTFFPDLTNLGWERNNNISFLNDEHNAYPMNFQTWTNKQKR